MEKQKQVKAHTRKTKSGKTVNVKAHSAKYRAAEGTAKEAIKKSKGAGDEYQKKGTDKFGNSYYSDSKGNACMVAKDGKCKTWSKMNPDERRRAGKYL